MSIRVEHVSKRFGELGVVDDLSLDIADGELFVLLGASGSGKSTVLRLIAGLAAPDAGRVWIAGRDVTDLPPQARGTGFVFQNYSLFRHMTVAENVEFPLRLRGVAPAARAERRDRLLDLVDLAGLDARLPEQLSGGQRQRVALARALIYEPAVLLLDEPFGALDAKIRTQLRHSLKGVQDALGITTVLVTHDQEEAFELGDRIAILERGRLLEAGTPEEIYRQPQSLFVATFVGAGTVLAGRVVAGRVHFGTMELPLPAGGTYEDGATVRLLARPEDVVLSPIRPREDTAILGEGTVAETSFMGSHQRWRVRLPHQPGCRQLAPRQAFGEQGIVIEAAISDDELPPRAEVWVGLRRWHFLAQGPRNILLPVDALPEPRLVNVVVTLARRLGATLTLLGVSPTETKKGEAGDTLDVWARELARMGLADVSGHPAIATRSGRVTGFRPRLRTGDLAEHVLAEQRDTAYELTLLAGLHGDSDRDSKAIARAVLERGRGPVLIGRPASAAIQRVLICTAAGEPGKSDVRVGGWLAARLGAAVTLFHATTPARPVTDLARGHLNHAAADLTAMDVPCVVTIGTAESASAGILNEVRSGNHDLVVIGGHQPPAGLFAGAVDVTWQIVTGTTMPVLVVPEDAWV